MEPNPYQSPAHQPQSLPPNKLSIGARLTFAGAALFGVGTVVYVGWWYCYDLLMAKPTWPPSNWYAIVAQTAAASAIVGAVIALIGGVVRLVGQGRA